MPALVRSKLTATKATPAPRKTTTAAPKKASAPAPAPPPKEPPSIVDTLANPSQCDDDLAARLASALNISPPAPTSKKRAAATSRAGPSTSKPKSAKAKATNTAGQDPSSSKNDPAPTPSSSSKIDSASWVPTADSESSSSSEADRINLAMSAYNAASQSLADILKSEWKAAKPSAAYPLDRVLAVISSCRVALRGLRNVDAKSRALDIEKAANAFAGKLVTMELFEEALTVIVEMKPALLALYPHQEQATSLELPPPSVSQNEDKTAPKPTAKKVSSSSRMPPTAPNAPSPFAIHQHADDHCLPLPLEGETVEPALLDVLARFQSQAVHILSRLSRKTSALPFDQILNRPGNFLDWYPAYNVGAVDPARLTAILNGVARNVSSVETTTSEALLRVRLWVMTCVGLSNAIPAERFWSQVLSCPKVFVQSVKTNSGTTESDVAAAKEVSLYFERLLDFLGQASVVGNAASTSPKAAADVLFQGQDFVAACEYWMRFARYLNDVSTIGRISLLLGRETSSATDSSSPEKYKGAVALAATQIRATLSKAVVVLGKMDSELAEDHVRHLDEAVSVLPQSVAHIRAIASSGDDDHANARKLARTVDELGRVCLKVLTSGGDVQADVVVKVKSLAEGITLVGEKVLTSKVISDPSLVFKDDAFGNLLDGTTESLYVLAKLTLQPSGTGRLDPMGATKAYALLNRAYSVSHIGSTPLPDAILSLSSEFRTTYANRLRILSNFYHNCGAKASVAQSAAFWRRSAELGEEALAVRDSVDEKDDAEVWTALREKQIDHRWSVLGAALGKGGERKLAHEAYLRSLTARPRSFYESMVKLTRTLPIRATFGQLDPKFSSTIERITSLETFDLFSFRDGEASIRKALDAAGVPAEAVGAILEYQVLLLDIVVHKEEAAGAIKVLLKELKDVYGSVGEFPVRRARVMLRALELAYSVDESSLAPSPMVVHGLLGSKNLGLDAQLAPFIPQYSVSLEVLLSLQAHRHHEADESTAIILQHAKKAIQALKGMVHVEPPQIPQRQAAKGGRGAASKSTKAPAAPARATRTPAAARTTKTPAKAKVAAKTPKPKANDVDALVDAVIALKITPSHGEMVLDDGEQFYRKLDSLAHLLGLLGHFFVKLELLDSMCRLCEAASLPVKADAMVLALVTIAYEYVKLGKFDHASAVMARGSKYLSEAEEEVCLTYSLRCAEMLAIQGQTEEAVGCYNTASARSINSAAAADKSASTIVRVRSRIAAIEHAALACNAYAAIQLSTDNMTTAIAGLMQALRLWNRALDMLTKIRPTADAKSGGASSGSPNPFQVNVRPTTPTVPNGTAASEPRVWDAFMDGLNWRLAEGLAATLFALGRLHFVRGSIKPAEFFIQKANALAISLNAPVLLSRALAREAEKEIAVGRLDPGHALLLQAAYSWEQIPDVVGPDLADLHRLQAIHSQRLDREDEAKRIYATASELLDQLEKIFEDSQLNLGLGPAEKQNSKDLDVAFQPLVPALLASLLRQHILLLRTEVGENPLYNDLLERFLALPPSIETKVEENALLGQLAFEEVLARLDSDLFLSTIPESVMAIPMGMSSGEGAAPPMSTREILAALDRAEEFFWTGFRLSSKRGEVSQMREMALTLTLIHAYQTALGQGKEETSAIAFGLLDMAAAITLRREMGETIDGKFRDPSDDLAWPRMSANGSPRPSSVPNARGLLFGEESDDEDVNPGANMKSYWQQVKGRYRPDVTTLGTSLLSQVALLPDHWTVVNISVTDDKRTLFISRLRPRTEPLVFCLPLDRRGRREGEDEDDQFSFAKAIAEFADIIRLNDESTSNAKHISTKEGRSEWWSDRNQLDTRLKELLENIEYCWLGAFKAILDTRSNTSAETFNAFRQKIDKILKRNNVMAHDRKNQSRPRLDDATVECFSSLSPKCKDEELEDLIYFILDLYQLHGVSIALEEVDIDQLVVDLRAMLEEHSAKAQGAHPVSGDPHLFLVLDKHVQGLPWESIPILRGRSVSRVPSVSFLVDRLSLLHHTQKGLTSPSNEVIDRTTVDPLKTFYVLNPTGDLSTTQTTYEKKFKDLEAVGWRGVTGRAPSEEEMLHGFEKSDLVLYFGHGGGEHYIRSHKIRQLPRCAVTMLWGCSSGALREMGDFDRIGTPNHYMLAGCPTLVANLWDVTDREIDRVAQSVLGKLHIDKEHLNAHAAGQTRSTEPISVVQAVAESRDVCKLKYLTGAAPVVYGIPFYL